MSEDKPDYVVDAMEMMGQGYEQPAAVIDPPRNVTALKDRGLVEYKAWGWVKMSSAFIAHINRLRGSKLATWQVIALSIDEKGKCSLPVKNIAEFTGYSVSETRQAIAELEQMGYLSVARDTGKRSIYSPEFAARSTNIPTNEPKLDPSSFSTPLVGKGKISTDPSSPSEEKSALPFNRVKRVNKEKNILGIEASIFAGRKTTEQDLPQWENREKAACNAFETAFGIDRPWNWYPAKTTLENEWREFRAYLVELYEQDHECFIGYAAWANQQYSRGAKNASQLKSDPSAFPAAWAAYKSSDMYGKKASPQNTEGKGFYA